MVVVDVAQLDRAFWVVLGTLSALRSSVAETGITVLESVVGTIGGFLVAAGVLFVVEREHIWVMLPLAIFAASSTATAIGHTVGQGGFTVMSVVPLHLAEPIGWSIGLLRVDESCSV